MGRPQPVNDGSPTHTLQRAASRLREDVLRIDADGQFLGSEDELQTRLGVSRPTLRQVARILEAEQLLTVRRGVNGGFFSRRPSGEAVADMTSVYLRSVHTPMADVVRTQSLLTRECVELAASDPDPEARAGLTRWVAATEDDGRLDDPRRFHELAIEFGRILGAMSGSPTLGLFMDVTFTLGLSPVTVRVFDDAERRASTRRYQRDVSAAVEAGDLRRALQAQREQSERTAAWDELRGARFGDG